MSQYFKLMYTISLNRSILRVVVFFFLRYLQGSLDKLKTRSKIFIFFIYVFSFFIVKISVTSAIVINVPTGELVPGETKGSFV